MHGNGELAYGTSSGRSPRSRTERARGVLIRTAIGLTAFLVCGQVDAAARSTVAAAEPAGFQQCEPIKGPQWVFPTDSFNRSDLFEASIQSSLYESFTVNFGCAQAATFIKQIITQTLPLTTAGTINHLTVGPGYSCIAYPDRNGLAYAGSCVSGGSKFDWNYNVMWHGVPDSSTGEGGLGIEPMGTIEYLTVLRPLGNGHYELVVQNTSAIGSINSFSWASPAGLTITAVTGSTGAKCSLVSGAISCQGNIHPPQCLCTGSGGQAVIEFTASGDPTTTLDGHADIHGFGWTYLRISAMTPVPYLIPDTPQTANNKKSV